MDPASRFGHDGVQTTMWFSMSLVRSLKEENVPTHVRLVHKVLDGYHVFTSPDLKGLHVSAPTEAAAQLEAVKVLHVIAQELGAEPPVATFPTMAEAA
jgi:hypothetical protein